MNSHFEENPTLLGMMASGEPQRLLKPFFVCLTLLILSVVTSSLAYSEDWTALLDASLHSSQEKESIRTLFQEAREEAVPEKFLTSRLAEGIAKRVSGKTLLAALERELSLLLAARVILTEAAHNLSHFDLNEDRAAWARTANLLSKGISPKDISKIARAYIHRWKDYREATYLYVKLFQWGVRRLDALNVTVAVAGSPAPGEQISGIFELFVKGRRRRISPETLAVRIINSLPNVRNLRELEREILHE